jgi:hypothetical protein
MDRAPGLLSLFSLQLGIGSQLLLTVLPLGGLGGGFLRFMSLLDGIAIALGWWLLPARWGSPMGYAVFAALILVAIDAMAAGQQPYRESKLTRLPQLGCGLGALGLGAELVANAHGLGPMPTAAVLLAHLAGAFLLGSVLLDLILGHWYLVVPGLSIRPFMLLSRLLLGALVARAGVVSAALALYGGGFSGFDTLEFWVGRGIFWVMAAGCGLAVPLALSGFLLRTVELRSTQAATGIVYIIVFFVLMGELAFRYLAASTGLPL